MLCELIIGSIFEFNLDIGLTKIQSFNCHASNGMLNIFDFADEDNCLTVKIMILK